MDDQPNYWLRTRRIPRRDFLRRAGAASAAFALLPACTGRNRAVSRFPSAHGLARPHDPATLPIHEGNSPIEDGLEPEGEATLKVYNWDEYIYPRVVRAFEEQYDVRVEVTAFANMDEALPTLLGANGEFDVFFHRVDVIGRLVAANLLRPLNHSYITNMDENVWPVYLNPFYDLGWRYTVPYTVYTTGIAWRADLVDEDISARPNPYEIFWDKRYRGRMHVFNDYREVLSLALLKNGITNVNSTDASDIEAARDDLMRLSDTVSSLDIDAYSDLPAGESWIHQSWSGDLIAAPYYFPKGGDPSVLRYWFPEKGGGVVANDVIGIPRRGKNPVLAHHFINYLLDSDVAVRNYAWNGYQPPVKALPPGRLLAEEYVPAHLKSVVVRRSEFNRSHMQLELDPDADRMWHDAYDDFAGSMRS